MKTYTFKIVYYLPPEQWKNGSIKGVAFVEGYDRSHAIGVFQQQYKGQFSTIDTCEKMG